MPAPPSSRGVDVFWTPPSEFEGFRVVRPLGFGGMGCVYLGHDIALDRPVALKFISSLNPSRVRRDRFLVEARAIARLQHPNVVAVYRIGEILDRQYLAYEFIGGESLDSIDKPIPWQKVLHIGRGVARGLAAAHARGVLHRDIKPGNVMLAEDGEVKLLDFGIAKLIDEGARAGDGSLANSSSSGQGEQSGPDLTILAATASYGSSDADLASHVTTTPVADTLRSEHTHADALRGATLGPATLTRTGSILGTPLYLPPELWSGAPATVRSDLYALGLLLYELASDELPHRSLDFETMSRVVPEMEVAPLRSVRPEIPELFAEIVDRCVRRAPEERFASADEVRDALEQAEVLFRAVGLVREEARGISDAEAGDEERTVTASYGRVAGDVHQLVARFYERLFLVRPDFRPMFPADLREQRLKFAGTLQLLIENLQKPDALAPLLEELGRRHAAYGVRPDHFEAVGGALLGALADFDAAAWSPDLERAWTSAYGRFTEHMKRGLLRAV